MEYQQQRTDARTTGYSLWPALSHARDAYFPFQTTSLCHVQSQGIEPKIPHWDHHLEHHARRMLLATSRPSRRMLHNYANGRLRMPLQLVYPKSYKNRRGWRFKMTGIPRSFSPLAIQVMLRGFIHHSLCEILLLRYSFRDFITSRISRLFTLTQRLLEAWGATESARRLPLPAVLKIPRGSQIAREALRPMENPDSCLELRRRRYDK
ncbi:uncharacterized protein J3D65DRAFT_279615 [Phyllosticta citribraziliensis]|uniref:Uncharacterized protein n=1 Tax=Phyllosticta citribraziliensis TaxID=989973 RepID=A0ABR1LW49_9PEZI